MIWFLSEWLGLEGRIGFGFISPSPPLFYSLPLFSLSQISRASMGFGARVGAWRKEKAIIIPSPLELIPKASSL
jgi:hypothetical protein